MTRRSNNENKTTKRAGGVLLSDVSSPHESEPYTCVLYVHAIKAPRVARKDMCPHDLMAAGIYSVNVSAALTDTAAAACALAEFHRTVLLKHPDHIRTSVLDRTGKELFAERHIDHLAPLMGTAGPVTKLRMTATYMRFNTREQWCGRR